MINVGEHFANRKEHIQNISGNVNSLSQNSERFLEMPVDNSLLSVIQWTARFIETREAGGCAKKTISKYKTVLNSYIDFQKQELMKDIARSIEAWVGMTHKTKKMVSAPSYIHEMETIARWLLKNGLIARMPQIKCKRPKTLPKALRLKEVSQAIPLFDTETAFLLKFLTCTALRIGAALSLTRDNFDLETMNILVYSKGNKLQKVTVAKSLQEECRRRVEALDDGEKLFSFAHKTYYTRVRKVREKLPFKLHFHILRHTFARHFCMNGGGVPALQAILGHSTPDMSLHYARVFSDDALRLQREINPIDAMAKGK